MLGRSRAGRLLSRSAGWPAGWQPNRRPLNLANRRRSACRVIAINSRTSGRRALCAEVPNSGGARPAHRSTCARARRRKRVRAGRQTRRRPGGARALPTSVDNRCLAGNLVAKVEQVGHFLLPAKHQPTDNNMSSRLRTKQHRDEKKKKKKTRELILIT